MRYLLSCETLPPAEAGSGKNLNPSAQLKLRPFKTNLFKTNSACNAAPKPHYS
jgi:hypothetical protein